MKFKIKDYIFIGLVLIGFGILGYQKFLSPSDIGEKGLELIKVGPSQVLVEVVSTPAAKEKGLGERETMKMNEGMLFVHEMPGRYKYSMRGMLFDLDFVFIRDDIVVDIAKKVSRRYQGIIEGGADYNYVLEVNADWTRLNNVQIGAKVDLD